MRPTRGARAQVPFRAGSGAHLFTPSSSRLVIGSDFCFNTMSTIVNGRLGEAICIFAFTERIFSALLHMVGTIATASIMTKQRHSVTLTNSVGWLPLVQLDHYLQWVYRTIRHSYRSGVGNASIGPSDNPGRATTVKCLGCHRARCRIRPSTRPACPQKVLFRVL